MRWNASLALALLGAGCGVALIEVGGAAPADLGAATDGASPTDAGRASDLAAPARDLTPPGPDLLGCKTTCGGAECGMIPNGCGATVACGDCGMPGEVCITMPMPLFPNAVRGAIETVKVQHPGYFNLNDTKGGGSVKVLDMLNFVNALVAELNMKGGLFAIVDPNDPNEIRVRPLNVMSAENYHVITSAGYSAYKYTSTCTPAGF